MAVGLVSTAVESCENAPSFEELLTSAAGQSMFYSPEKIRVASERLATIEQEQANAMEQKANEKLQKQLQQASS